jgi:IS5 family transposase
LRAEGPRPEQAVAEAISATVALAAQGKWPGPRDAVAERAVEKVRRRWLRIAQNARQAR